MTQNKQIPQFKVWDNDKQEWLTDPHYNLVINNLGEVFYLPKKDRYFLDFPLSNATICRFTGIIFNGVPVYQDDIVKFNDHGYRLGVIKFSLGDIYEVDIGTFYIELFKPFYNRKKYNTLNVEIVEIVGNRLSNPELLGGNDEN